MGIGAVAGNEVAQAYIELKNCSSEPILLLRGFNRTRLLHPGEQEEVHFAFRKRDLSVYHVDRGWTRVPHILVHIGSSSARLDHVVTIGGALPRSTPMRRVLLVLLGISALMHL